MIMKNVHSVRYFGFGTNRDHDMMAHMIGRAPIHGEYGTLFGFELCVLRGRQFRDIVPKASPLTMSPRAIIVGTWGPDFLMYVSRPNPTGSIAGMIWDMTPEEFQFVREWEMVEYGAQEDAQGIAMTAGGAIVNVITQSFLTPPIPEIERVIGEDDYEPYIAPKDEMLKRADEVRMVYMKVQKSG
ncbi:gamma-glutamylcyclotransferase [Candidatus Uhrbacteria bacterium]|nr:gamma-glutamylcyclotransferase [Candidatus Uhrbacteria bacterium]